MAELPDLNDFQFAQWVELLEKRAGVIVPEERRSFLVTGLKLRMQEIGCSSYQEYYDRLCAGSGAEEWTTLVDRLTVHETRFFRHSPSLQLVTKHCLPAKASEEGDSHSFQIWSVGCATGEEAYTLAMMIDDYFIKLGGDYFFGITACDVSRPALETARQGRYSNRRLGDVPLDMRSRYCEPDGPDHFRIVNALRNRVCFSQLNVVKAANAPYGKMDLIFCQNLLIYFDRDHRRQIVDQLADQLRPGGTLVLGPGEVMDWQRSDLERVRFENTLAYRRREPDAQGREAS